MGMTQSTWMKLSFTKERKDLPFLLRGIWGTVSAAFRVPQMLWPQVKDQTRRRRSPGELVQQFYSTRLEMRHLLLARHCQRPLCQPLRISKHPLLGGKLCLV